MEKIILADRNGYPDAMEEEKYTFLRNILLAMELKEIQEIMPEDHGSQTIEDRIKLRQLLRKFNLFTIEHRDILEIYLDRQLMASIKKKFAILKQDPNQIDPSKKTYLEIHLEINHPFAEN